MSREIEEGQVLQLFDAFHEADTYQEEWNYEKLVTFVEFLNTIFDYSLEHRSQLSFICYHLTQYLEHSINPDFNDRCYLSFKKLTGPIIEQWLAKCPVIEKAAFTDDTRIQIKNLITTTKIASGVTLKDIFMKNRDFIKKLELRALNLVEQGKEIIKFGAKYFKCFQKIVNEAGGTKNVVQSNQKGIDRLVDKMADNNMIGKGTYNLYDVLRARIQITEGSEFLRVLQYLTDPKKFVVVKLANNLDAPLANINMVIQFNWDENPAESFVAEVQLAMGKETPESHLNHFFYEIKRAETFEEIETCVRAYSKDWKDKYDIKNELQKSIYDGVYDGQMFNGNRHGYGSHVFTSDNLQGFVWYKGQWEYHKKTGSGLYKYEKGDKTYEGEFMNDVQDGYGIQKWESEPKGIYEGQFKMFQKNGQGKIYWENGDKFEGAFTSDLKNGPGIMTYADGHTIEVNFDNGVKSGLGKEVWANGVVYEGMYADEKLNGHGKMTLNKDEWYEGEYLNGKKEGKGKYHWGNGTEYEGEYKNDLMDGEGVLTFTTKQVQIGIFKDGKYVGPKP